MGLRIRALFFFIFFLFLFSFNVHAIPAINSGPTSMGEAQLPRHTLPSGYSVIILGYQIYLYSPNGTLVAHGYLHGIAAQLEVLNPNILLDLEGYILETLAFLDSQVLTIGELVQMVQSLLMDLAIPDWGNMQSFDLIFVGSFNLANGNDIWVYNVTGTYGVSGVFRVNSATGEGRFTPAHDGVLGQNPDGSTYTVKDGSSDEDDGSTSGQGDGGDDDDDDGIFIPPSDGNQGGSGGGTWGDDALGGGINFGGIQGLQTTWEQGQPEIDSQFQP